MSYGERKTRTRHYCGCETLVVSRNLSGTRHDRLVRTAEDIRCDKCNVDLKLLRLDRMADETEMPHDLMQRIMGHQPNKHTLESKMAMTWPVSTAPMNGDHIGNAETEAEALAIYRRWQQSIPGDSAARTMTIVGVKRGVTRWNAPVDGSGMCDDAWLPVIR